MKSIGQRRREVFGEINITPLTDIFLVLLIIMMVVAPMLDSSGLKLSVPSVGPSEDVTEDPKVLRIGIAEDNTYAIDGQPVSPDLLMMKLQQMKTDYPDGVIIETHPEATHEALTAAMDAAQTAGITKLAVMAAEAADSQAELPDNAGTP